MSVPTDVDRTAPVIVVHDIQTVLDASLGAWLGHLKMAAESSA